MTLVHDDWIGLRVARWRDIAGLRQEDLAARIGVSREYISMIENGRKPVTKRSRLIALAEALGVAVSDLTATPTAARTPAEQALHDAVPDVRAALDGAHDVPRPAIISLSAQVDQLMCARMACDYPELARLLAPILAASLALAEDDGSEAALNLFSQVCVTASLAIRPLGYVDLGTRLAERAQWAAARTGDPAHEAAASYALAQASLAGGVLGLRSRSLTLATRAADRIQAETDNDARAWYGLLHLQAALAASTLGSSDDAMAHIDEAASVTGATEGDPWRMEFTNANVGVWRAGVALESGESGRAIEYARQVDTSQLRTVQRRAALLVHTARALYLDGRNEESVRAFLEADTVAPNEVRSRTTVRELAGQMIRDARRHAGSDAMRDLAVRVGIDPMAPEA